jgi:diguanylate cyclase (GGDEF)-like protein
MSELNHFRILIVDDNPAIHQDFQKILVQTDHNQELDQLEDELFGTSRENVGECPVYEIDNAMQGLEGVEKVAQAIRDDQPYSLAFVDMRMPPGISGLETIRLMWERSPDLQVVICTAYSDYSWFEIITQLGWTDRLLILKKPFDQAEVCQLALAMSVKHQLEQLARLQTEELRMMVSQRTVELEKEIHQREQVESMLRDNPTQVFDSADVDQGTGLLNRKAIIERINFMASDADEHNALYSVLFFDIDGLQDVNDAFGHLVGDLVLKNVAQRLKETLRPHDVIGRHGGEEFIIGLRNCSRENAVIVAERLRQRVADSSVIVEGNELMITVSVGVATQDPEIRAVTKQVLACADEALYLAKNNGRNRVESKLLVAG